MLCQRRGPRGRGPGGDVKKRAAAPLGRPSPGRGTRRRRLERRTSRRRGDAKGKSDWDLQVPDASSGVPLAKPAAPAPTCHWLEASATRRAPRPRCFPLSPSVCPARGTRRFSIPPRTAPAPPGRSSRRCLGDFQPPRGRRRTRPKGTAAPVTTACGSTQRQSAIAVIRPISQRPAARRPPLARRAQTESFDDRRTGARRRPPARQCPKQTKSSHRPTARR